MSTISRRAFLKTVGVGALSVAAMSVLAGCEGVGTPVDTTPVVNAVEGKIGSQYPISDVMVVSVRNESDVAFTNNWAKAYVKAYTDYSVDSADDYKALTENQKADVKEKAEKAASLAKADSVSVVFAFTMLKSGADPIILAESGEAGKYVSSVFAASCNGSALKCTINKVALTQSNTVTCTVELPNNTKSFDLTIALPGSDKAVKYTIDNDGVIGTSKNNNGYLEIDPTKDEFYKYGVNS